jgi:hypothetical protein|tara:strand:+ start:1055 stop:1207 length:153 start_codon:yes stop_codon:yes gene_type:complete
MDKHRVLELLIDAIEREDWSMVEDAIKIIKGEDEYVEMLDFDNEDARDIY